MPASKVYDGTTTAVVSGTATLLTAETAGTGSTTDDKPYSGRHRDSNGHGHRDVQLQGRGDRHHGDLRRPVVEQWRLHGDAGVHAGGDHHPANQTINWAPPARIVATTALSGTQLNATAAGVPGEPRRGPWTYSLVSTGAPIVSGTTTLNSGLQQGSSGDGRGDRQITVSATYTVYIDVYPGASGLQIEMIPGQPSGIAGRSYIRYVDLIFGSPTLLASLANAGNFTLKYYNDAGQLQSNPPVPISSAAITPIGTICTLISAPTASPATRAHPRGDGIYDLAITPAVGPAVNYWFFRLLGDVAGTGTVTTNDSTLILNNYGK